MKKLTVAFAVIVLLVAAYFAVRAYNANTDILSIGNFLVLTLTLIILAVYAYDTNRIARITEERWTQEGAVYKATYSLNLLENTGRTIIKLHNPSTLVIFGNVTLAPRVYGEPVKTGDLYDGRRNWVVHPAQFAQGWIELSDLLGQKGKTTNAMKAECNDENRKQQLTLDLAIWFRDETGITRALPGRHYYFDFKRWTWIPQLGEPDSYSLSEVP